MIESTVFLILWVSSCRLQRYHGEPILHLLDELMTWSDVLEEVRIVP